MTDIPDGYGFVAVRKRAIAARLLEIAAEQKLEAREIRAVSDGYIVPLSVLDAYEGVSESDAPSEESPAEGDDYPTSDWKNAEIKSWAEANGVDLDGATTKADMLAAIDAAQNKEE